MNYQKLINQEKKKCMAETNVAAEIKRNKVIIFDENMKTFDEFVDFINPKYKRKDNKGCIEGYKVYGIQARYTIDVYVGCWGNVPVEFTVDSKFNFVIKCDTIEEVYKGSTKNLDTFIPILIKLIVRKYKK